MVLNGSVILPSSSQVLIALDTPALLFLHEVDIFDRFQNKILSLCSLPLSLGMAKCGTSAMYEMLSRFPNASKIFLRSFCTAFILVSSECMCTI